METRTDWTPMVLAWGQSRNWQSLATTRRTLRRLRDFAAERGISLPAPASARDGMAAAIALHRAYTCLAEATETERAACKCWKDVKDLIARRDAVLAAAQAAEERSCQDRLDAMADKDGWLLLAGEETEIVARGTRAVVLAALPRMLKCPRDRCGLGAYSILAPDGSVADAGYFDKHMSMPGCPRRMNIRD